ncbi:MAG: mechanosensitive ion channel domain-containing protein [Gammaproteobacteria bacterium]
MLSIHQVAAMLLCMIYLPFTLAQTDQTTADSPRAQIEDLRAAIVRLADAPAPKDDALAFERLVQKERLVEKLQNLIGTEAARIENNVSVSELEKAGAQQLIGEQTALLKKLIIELRETIETLRSRRIEAPAAGSLAFEQRLRKHDDLLSTVLRMHLVNVQRGARIGRDGTADLAELDNMLKDRADVLSERMEIVLSRHLDAKKRLGQAAESEKANVQAEIIALAERKNRLKSALTSTIAIMRERGIDVSQYSQFLISATGEISGDILDRRVLSGLANEWLGVVRNTIKEDGPKWLFKTIIFTVIVLAFWLLSRIVRNIVKRMVAGSRIQFSTLLQNFFVKLSSSLVLILGLFIGLAQIGVQLAPILAGMGVAGFILGFALQESLSNFASGMMILTYRPFDVGDVIEAGGVSGKVHQMSLVSTTILTFDNQMLIVPNNKIWGDVIRNVNAQDKRRVDLVFSISYADDIEKSEAILKELVTAHPSVLADPEPNIRLHKLAESSVDFIARPWVNADDYWTVYWELTKQVKQRFDADGITIPFPQRDVHIHGAQTTQISA